MATALRELLAEFGIEVDTKKLDHANEKLDGFIEKVEKVGKQVLTAFAVKEVFEFAEGVAHQIHAVEASAAALGITTQATQQYRFASQAAGEDAGTLLNLMGRMQVSAVQAAKGAGTGGKAFKELGVNVKDTNGQIKPAGQLFEDVAEGIKNTVDPAKRAALATEVFGRSGRMLLPFLIKGRSGIKALRAEFDALGGGFDEEAIEKSKDFEHSMAKVSVVADGIKSVLVHGVFPVLTWVANKAAAIGGWFVRISKNTDLIRNALIVLGAYLTPLAFSMAAAFAPIILATAAIAALILIVDDLIGLFTGADSEIGEVIDKVFGKGQSAEMVKAVKDAWLDVKEAFREMWPYVKQVYEALKWIVEHTVELGGALGDAAAKADNAAKEEDGMKRGGRGGLTNTQNDIGLNAQAILEAKQRGEDIDKFQVPNVPKGFTPASAKAAAMAILPQVNRGDAGFTQFQSRAVIANPSAMPASGGGQGDMNVGGHGDMTVNVNVQGTNAQPHEIQAAAEKGVRAGTQRQYRAAKHTLTQAGQKP